MSGSCTSTVPMEKTIGNEKEWAKNCFLDLKSDLLEPKCITTDPDSSAYRAATEMFTNKVIETVPQYQIDTRHLGKIQRKYIRRQAAVLKMMPGLTKSYRETMRNRFSTDMSMKCKAEFDNIHQQVNGTFLPLKVRISAAKPAIAKCYSGEHSLCSDYSSVCNGAKDNNWIVKSTFLTSTFQIDTCNPTHKQTIEDCINYRLGPQILEITKLNTNTQKVESVNQAIRRSLPKRLTFPCCFPGRAHSAVFSVNNGPSESLVRLFEEMGCHISNNSRVAAALLKEQSVSENSRVAAALLKEQSVSEKEKLRGKSKNKKTTRKQRRLKLYQIYEKHKEEASYLKGLLLKQA